MLWIILEVKGEDIFQKDRKVLSFQSIKVLQIREKMNGFLVQIIKSLVISFSEVMGIESIL